jgi:Fic family protein
MKPLELQILKIDLLSDFISATSAEILTTAWSQLSDAPLSTKEFSFYTSVASVYSSKIEGATIELDSYVKHKRFGIAFEPDYTRKIDDLYLAYEFAQHQIPDKANISQAHTILVKHIVAKNWQGKFRSQNMYATTNDGRIEYVATSPFEVDTEMNKFYADLGTLLVTDLTIQETFFFASLIHLVFVKIHPWNDGNGRSARLLEKWFLAQKLGPEAWFIQSEKYYYIKHQEYYNHIRLLGIEYTELDYSKALPFLLMLPQALVMKEEQ